MSVERVDTILIPEHMQETPMWERIDWLLADSRDDDLFSGTPYYKGRYTGREQEILSLLRGAIDYPRSVHDHLAYPIDGSPMTGRCAFCGVPMPAADSGTPPEDAP